MIFPSTNTSTCAGSPIVNSPLGPTTLTVLSETDTATPDGTGITFLAILDIIFNLYHTWAIISPPTFNFLAFFSDIIPAGVDSIFIPKPPSTRGNSRNPPYTRFPGLLTRLIQVTTGVFFLYFKVIISDPSCTSTFSKNPSLTKTSNTAFEVLVSGASTTSFPAR